MNPGQVPPLPGRALAQPERGRPVPRTATSAASARARRRRPAGTHAVRRRRRRRGTTAAPRLPRASTAFTRRRRGRHRRRATIGVESDRATRRTSSTDRERTMRGALTCTSNSTASSSTPTRPTGRSWRRSSTQFGVNVVAQLADRRRLPGAAGRGGRAAAGRSSTSTPARRRTSRRSATCRGSSRNVSFFLMSQVLDANLLMEAMHLGVKEFIPLPISEEKFAAAVERVAAEPRHGQAGEDHPRDPDDGRVRVDDGRLQRRGVAGQARARPR